MLQSEEYCKNQYLGFLSISDIYTIKRYSEDIVLHLDYMKVLWKFCKWGY